MFVDKAAELVIDALKGEVETSDSCGIRAARKNFNQAVELLVAHRANCEICIEKPLLQIRKSPKSKGAVGS